MRVSWVDGHEPRPSAPSLRRHTAAREKQRTPAKVTTPATTIRDRSSHTRTWTHATHPPAEVRVHLGHSKQSSRPEPGPAPVTPAGGGSAVGRPPFATHQPYPNLDPRDSHPPAEVRARQAAIRDSPAISEPGPTRVTSAGGGTRSAGRHSRLTSHVRTWAHATHTRRRRYALHLGHSKQTSRT